MFWKGCTTYCYIDYFGVKWTNPLNSMQFNTLKHSKESGKNQKTFTVACQRLKYEIHENLWNVRLEVYSKFKTSLLNHPWRICCFFILSFTVKKSVKCCFWFLVVRSQLPLQHWKVCETNFTLTRIGEKYIYSEGKIIWSPADFVCLPTDKEMISL